MTPWGFVKHGWIKDELKGSCPVLQLVYCGGGKRFLSQVVALWGPRRSESRSLQAYPTSAATGTKPLLQAGGVFRRPCLHFLEPAMRCPRAFEGAPKIQDSCTTLTIPNCTSSQSVICSEKHDNSWFVLKCMPKYYDHMIGLSVCPTYWDNVPHFDRLSRMCAFLKSTSCEENREGFLLYSSGGYPF